MDCLLSAEWKSPSKIIARTGPGKGKGDILITTRSAGNGSCTVGFRGYFLQTGLSYWSRFVTLDVFQVSSNQINKKKLNKIILVKIEKRWMNTIQQFNYRDISRAFNFFLSIPPGFLLPSFFNLVRLCVLPVAGIVRE